MSHGNLSPRQKMINMMYLILTALLAMNVSAEVLNAFVMVNESIRNTEDVIRAKNDALFTEFNSKYEANPNKVKPWKDVADQVKIETEDLIAFIESLKEEILTGAGEDTEKYDTEGTGTIQKKDERELPMYVMKEQGNALKLKEKIDAYREKLISIYNEKGADSSAIVSLRTNLNTDPVVGQEGKEIPWEIANFDQLPMVAVLTMLSKMKTDILNAEADMVAFLFNKIEAGSFKFNKLEAIVKPEKSDLVLQGEPYKAYVFIAASDTTQEPQIIMSGGNELPIDPTTKYGIFTGPTGSPGIKPFSGTIKVLRPGSTNDYIDIDFDHEYQVTVPSVSVSPTKMNVFYIGVDNPVDVTAAGIAASDISVSMSGGGSITPRGNGKYIARVRGGTSVRVNVSAEGRSLGSKEFRVKRVPDPYAVIGTGANKKGGLMPQTTLVNMRGIRAEMENFDFDLNFRITSFNVTCNIDGFDETARSGSGSFTSQQKNIMRKAKRGSRVIIEDVKAVGPDGTTRKLNDIVLKLQ